MVSVRFVTISALLVATTGREGQRARRWCAVIVAALALPLMSSCRIVEYVTGVRNGCIEWTSALDVDTSDEILRGTWRGTFGGDPAHDVGNELILDLSATFVDATRYAVTGSFKHGTAEPLAFDGTVYGRCSERYVARTASDDDAWPMAGGEPTRASAPPSAELIAEVRDAGGVVVWMAYAHLGAFSGGPHLKDGVMLLTIEPYRELGRGMSYAVVDLVRTGSP
jgi:hypothetical protein